MDTTAWLFAGCGLAALAAALLPGILHRLPVSVPIVFLGAGTVVFLVLPDLFTPDPLQYGEVTEHLTELTVIVSLMGAGLAIDRPFAWRKWTSTWGLLAMTMPLTIAAIAGLGGWMLGLAPAAAMLLGAALAPTDPVLASDVQVGEPSADPASEDEVRFALTSEAGLNDGLAFPFTYAAVAMSLAGPHPREWLARWLAFDFAYRIAAGVAVGLAVGWALGKLVFHRRPAHLKQTERSDAFVALAATALAYGAAELVEGYGFIAVFVCAVSIRSAERSHGYHGVMHAFIEQIERLLTVAVLVLLGGAIARGLLKALTPWDVAFAVAFVFGVRPLLGWLGVLRIKGITDRERAVIAFFGVRGIGSIYYLAFALNAAAFPNPERLWAVAGLVVALSVVVHGVAATPVMRHLDKRRAAREATRAESQSVERGLPRAT